MSQPRAAYNEIDPKAAAWLRELIRRGLIAPGDVIEASIEDLTPNDLKPYTQVHFFAGIGVWSYALRATGWPDDRPVWTGSCPCQPFSAAGKKSGFADERHLWPAFHWLIEQCRPDVVFGEQVASKDGLAWLDLVQADLEGTGYASGAVDLCAAGVGAPHIRQRLWWFGERLADAGLSKPSGRYNPTASDDRRSGARRIERGEFASRSATSRLGDDDDEGLEGQRGRHQAEGGWVGAAGPTAQASEFGRLADGTEPRRLAWRRFRFESDGRGSSRIEFGRLRDSGGMADSDGDEPWSGRDSGSASIEGVRLESSGRSDAGGMADNQHEQRSGSSAGGDVSGRWDEEPAAATGLRRNSGSSPTNGLWADADWLFCRDGKWRPVEPGTFPLAHGAPARVGRLRGYGNAIVAPAAQAFIEAYLETEADRGFSLTLPYDLSDGVFQ